MTIVERKNEMGFVEELAFFDGKGNPMLNDWGFARKILAYDANGNVIEERFYGLAGEPVLSNVFRCARIARSHRVDDNGRVVEERYYGLSGEPVLDAYGTAGRVWIYDVFGCGTEDISIGLADEPVVHKMYGCARTKRMFNSEHRIIEERYYGASGEPVRQKVHGFAKITWVREGGKVEKLYHRTLRSRGYAWKDPKLADIKRRLEESKEGSS